jgi:hypothetical protein
MNFKFIFERVAYAKSNSLHFAEISYMRALCGAKFCGRCEICWYSIVNEFRWNRHRFRPDCIRYIWCILITTNCLIKVYNFGPKSSSTSCACVALRKMAYASDSCEHFARMQSCCSDSNGKAKVLLFLSGHEGVWGSKRTAPLILNLDTSLKWVVSATPRQRTPLLTGQDTTNHREDLEVLERTEIICLCPNSISGPSSP